MAASQSPWSDSPTTDQAAAPDENRAHADRRRNRLILLAIIFAVLAVRGRAMLSLGESLNQDPDAYRELAENLHTYHQFGFWRNPASGSPVMLFGTVEPTAYRPPLYPLLLSIFHVLPAAQSAYGLFHVLLGVGTAVAVWRLGQLWGLGTAGTLLAVALVTVDPILINQSVQVMGETLATFLAAWALVALTLWVRDNSIRHCILAGGLLGLCVLCRPTFLVWLIGVAVVFPFVVSTDRRRGVLQTAALLATAAVVLAPWAIRNQLQFGRPIVTTTHGGYTLLLANNPSFYEYLREAPWGSVWNGKDLSDSAEARLRTLGVDEVELSQDEYAEAMQTIADEPGTFAYSCLVRVGRLWSVLPHQLNRDESPSRQGMRFAVAIWYALELLLALAGLWFLGKQLKRAPWIWGLLLLLSFTAVQSLYWTDMRMRAPLVTVVALLAAQGVVLLAKQQRDPTPLPANA